MATLQRCAEHTSRGRKPAVPGELITSPLHRVAAAAFALALLTAAAAAAEGPPAKPEGKPAAKAPRKPQTLITVSKETTYIIEPLRADGYVDYIAALNQRFSQGVTPENNAAVPLLKAMGPAQIHKDIRAQYFQLLGIAPLPEDGEYFLALDAYDRRINPDQDANADRKALWEAQGAAMSRAWTHDEFPDIAGWLEANEKPLELIVEASKRPRRYDPLLATGEQPMLIAVLLPMIQQHREAARALTARAMLKLGDGRPDEAWDDLLACHRLARLSGHGATLVEMLVAIAIDGVAAVGDRALLAQGDLSAAQARRMYDDLQKLGPLPKSADAIDLGERFMFHDCVQTMAAKGLGELNSITGVIEGKPKSTLSQIFSSLATAAVDWDVILRMGNTWYDRMVAAHRLPNRDERRAAMDEIDMDLHKLAKGAKDPAALAWAILAGGQVISERMGQVFIALLLPAVNAAASAEERGAMNLEIVKLGCLLAAYRAEQGKYPAALADLAPKYATKIPLDLFSGKPLVYKLQGGGYVLYSVGANGKDDGGLSYEDREHAPDGAGNYDDLVVQVPLKKREKRADE